MGWVSEAWRVSVCLDAHAGATEREHDALWRDLQSRLIAVCQSPLYAPLQPDYDEPELCVHRGSAGTRCVLAPQHEEPHTYRDGSGEYTETGP